MKGMLTGPVTILQLVVRARRPAALRGLPADRAGDPRRGAGPRERPASRMIQIDEAGAARGPAAAPVANGQAYLDWAVECVPALRRRACADETQIHTHMCYSEFNKFLPQEIEGDCDAFLDSLHGLRDGAIHPHQHCARRQHVARRRAYRSHLRGRRTDNRRDGDTGGGSPSSIVISARWARRDVRASRHCVIAQRSNPSIPSRPTWMASLRRK